MTAEGFLKVSQAQGGNSVMLESQTLTKRLVLVEKLSLNPESPWQQQHWLLAAQNMQAATELTTLFSATCISYESQASKSYSLPVKPLESSKSL